MKKLFVVYSMKWPKYTTDDKHKRSERKRNRSQKLGYVLSDESNVLNDVVNFINET